MRMYTMNTCTNHAVGKTTMTRTLILTAIVVCLIVGMDRTSTAQTCETPDPTCEFGEYTFKNSSDDCAAFVTFIWTPSSIPSCFYPIFSGTTVTICIPEGASLSGIEILGEFYAVGTLGPSKTSPCPSGLVGVGPTYAEMN